MLAAFPPYTCFLPALARRPDGRQVVIDESSGPFGFGERETVMTTGPAYGYGGGVAVQPGYGGGVAMMQPGYGGVAVQPGYGGVMMQPGYGGGTVVVEQMNPYGGGTTVIEERYVSRCTSP